MMVALGIIIVLVGANITGVTVHVLAWLGLLAAAWLTIGLVVAVVYGDSAKQRDSYVDVDDHGPTDGASKSRLTNREERAA